MTVTLELPSDIEAGLLARAESEGLPLSQLLQRMLADQFPRPGNRSAEVPPGSRPVLSPQERANAWRMSVANIPRTPPLSDDAIRRDTMYRDRG